MNLALQVKLLRLVQTGMVQPVGSDKSREVDTRIICATNRDPLAEVEAGRFREDLYYRLQVIPIELPPLRKRGGDVLLLARHFLAEFSGEEGRRFQGFSPEAEARPCASPWPGNVRQLQNVVRKTVVVHDGERSPAVRYRGRASRRGGVRGAEAAGGGRRDRATGAARATGERTVELCGGNMTEAAMRLGINLSAIYRQSWTAQAAQ